MVLYFQEALREENDSFLIDTAIRKGWKVRPDSPSVNDNEMPVWNWQEEKWEVEEIPLVEDNFDVELNKGYLVEPENFRLAMQESDRNQWTALRSQILDGLSMEKLTMDTPLIIWDIDHKPREVIVRRLREILFDSGIWYMQLKAKYSNLG